MIPLRTAVPVLCVLAALHAPVAGAQEARKASEADTADVTAVDAATGMLTVGGSDAARRYRIQDSTVIRVGNDRIPLSEISVGDRVVVTATEEGTSTEGPPVANTIEVVQQPSGTPDVAAGPGEGELRATLRNAQGAEVGEATLRETPNGVLVRATLRDLPAGEHGFHIHQTGRCDAPSFESAGGHLAPENRSHGFAVEGGPHAGDLPNLMIPSSGQLEVELFASDLRFAQLQDADGAALVVHAKPDDYRSQPSGGAGDRLACGVLAPAGAGQDTGGAQSPDA